jgi:hypothetical protein
MRFSLVEQKSKKENRVPNPNRWYFSTKHFQTEWPEWVWLSYKKLKN